MPLPHYWSRLYGITPNRHSTGQLLAEVEAALQGGLRCLQYRDKIADPPTRLQRALALKALCTTYAAQLIINDDYALSQAIGADGVHLGQGDGDPSQVRQLLGPDKIIGVSCHNSLVLATQAAPWADYLAFGAVYPSLNKPDAIQCSLSVFKTARLLHLPTVAIGGIRTEHCATLCNAGADALAVIGDLFDVPDIRQHTLNWLELLTRFYP